MAIFDGDRLKSIMDERRLTLCVAESLTCGNIQAMVGAVSGASSFFEGGMTAYSLRQKVALLDVDEEHAREVNSVSERVAAEMARGVAARFGCDIGIGTTGYAEPYPDENVPAPYAYFAIWRRAADAAGGEVVSHRRVEGDGLGRVEMQHRLAEEALAALLSYLEKTPAAN